MLRGVNVGGKRRVAMAELRDVADGLGYDDVRTYVQSGNVLLRTTAEAGDVERALVAAISSALDVDVEVLVRTLSELDAVLAARPFDDADPATLHVTFLAEVPTSDAAAALVAPEGIEDELVLIGREVHVRCPGGYGRTKLNNAFIERKLGVPATTRSHKSVVALRDLLRDTST